MTQNPTKQVNQSPREIITIQVSKYLTNELAKKIALAQWHSDAPEWVNRIRRMTYGDDYSADCFEVVALDQRDEVIGRLYCIQNEQDKQLWYYGDLFVVSEYRRMGVAKRMIRAAIDHLVELGAKVLRSYVAPDNAPSIALQKSVGFLEKPYRKFNDLIHENEAMFELALPSPYTVIPAGAEEAPFVMIFYRQNMEALHGAPISLEEWRDILSAEDEDERNFLICRGCMPVAWLRVNGLLNDDMAWISMLVVSDRHHHKGIGRFAVAFAEDYVRERGFRRMGIHTTADNLPAQALYAQCGYVITERDECEGGDGTRQMNLTLIKEFEEA